MLEFEDIAGAALGVGGGSSPGTNVVTPTFTDQAPISINPVGINLGAILRPFNEGSLENGGYGLIKSTSYWPNDTGNTLQADALGISRGNDNTLIIVSVAGMAALLLIVAAKKKKGR